MKYIIFKHPRSIKTRILSAFLAFLIFGLMFTSLFENFGFDKVKAVTQVSGPNIAMNTNETGIDGISYPVYKFAIPSTSPNRVIFRKSSSWDIDRTLTITLIGNGHGYVYYPTTVVDNGGTSHSYYPKVGDTTSGSRGYAVQVAESSGASINYSFTQHTSNKLYLSLSSNDKTNMKAFFFNYPDGSYYKNGVVATGVETSVGSDWPKANNGNGTYTDEGNTKYFYSWDVPCINGQYFNRVVFWNYNTENYWITDWIELDASNDYGKGRIVYRGSVTETKYTPNGELCNNPKIYSKELATHADQGRNPKQIGHSFDTVGNIEKIEGAANGEYLFDQVTFSGSAVTSGSTTSCTTTYQPEDRYDDADNYIYINGVSDPHIKFFDSGNNVIGSGTDVSTYGIKLTSTESGDYAGYYKIRLPKNAASFTVNGRSPITLNDDAGSRFTVDASGTVTHTIKRTTTPKPALTTDSFVSFRDVNNTWGSTVFAYFFGGTNGEYSEWQGVSPFKSYTDGSDTVYVFQYPSGGTTNYPKVIFNSGAYSANNNKRTDAITYAAGNIYQSTAAGAEYTPSTDADSNWVKLATVQTNNIGRIGSVTYIKNSSSDIDGEYIANTSAELSDGSKYIKVKKLGTYVWKETSAPPNYELAHDKVIIVTESQRGTTVTTRIEDHKIPVGSTNEIILTKTAKEKTNSANIGEVLSGAQFQLIKIDGNSFDKSLKFSKDSSTTNTNRYTYNASSGTYNVTGSWLTTGTDGVLHLKNLPVGDYYLEEQDAPLNYSKKDSNEVSGGVVQNRKVYFSVGDNTTTKEITCSDEMTPAYIKLYEHINDKKEAWGNPTFIFNIRNTASDGKTIRVALTVNDNDKKTDGLTTHTTLSYDYSSWYEESTVESEYHGMYHIDNQGRIRVEPGTYEITRVPVSRYEFVENTWKLSTTGDYQTNRDGTTEQLTINVPADDTATVHYYDKVAYYDKFTQVDTRINSFYQLDSSTKANRTVKGIRVMDYSVPGSTGSLNLTGSALTVYKVYVDGTEALMNSTEKSEITFSSDTSGDNSVFTPVLSDDSKTLIVSDVSSYTNNVYTLTATYSGFTDSFDLVFART